MATLLCCFLGPHWQKNSLPGPLTAAVSLFSVYQQHLIDAYYRNTYIQWFIFEHHHRYNSKRGQELQTVYFPILDTLFLIVCAVYLTNALLLIDKVVLISLSVRLTFFPPFSYFPCMIGCALHEPVVS